MGRLRGRPDIFPLSLGFPGRSKILDLTTSCHSLFHPVFSPESFPLLAAARFGEYGKLSYGYDANGNRTRENSNATSGQSTRLNTAV